MSWTGILYIVNFLHTIYNAWNRFKMWCDNGLGWLLMWNKLARACTFQQPIVLFGRGNIFWTWQQFKSMSVLKYTRLVTKYPWTLTRWLFFLLSCSLQSGWWLFYTVGNRDCNLNFKFVSVFGVIHLGHWLEFGQCTWMIDVLWAGNSIECELHPYKQILQKLHTSGHSLSLWF